MPVQDKEPAIAVTTSEHAARVRTPAPGVALLRAHLDHSLARHLPEEVARREQVVPVARTSAVLDVATLIVSDALADRLAAAAGCPVRLLVAFDQYDIACGLEAVYGPLGRAAQLRDEAVAYTLVRLCYLSAAALSGAMQRGDPTARLTDRLVSEGLVSEEAVAEAAALSLHLPYVRLGSWPVRPPLVRLAPRAMAEAWDLAPFAIYRGRLLVAISRPDALPALRELARVSGFPIAPVAAPRNAIRSALRVAWGAEAGEGQFDQALIADDLPLMTAARPLPNNDLSPLAMLNQWLRWRPQRLRALVRRARGRSDLRVDRTVAAWLPAALVQDLGGLPLRRRGDSLMLAVRQPLERPQLEVFDALFGLSIVEITVNEGDWKELVDRWFTPPAAPPAVVWPEAWWTSEEPLDGFLLSMGYVTPEQARAVRRRRVERNVSLRALLLESGALTEEALAEALGLWLGAPWVQVDQWIPEPDVPRLIPPELARRYGVLPLTLSGSGLLAAAVTPDSRQMAEQLGRDLGMTIRLAVASRSSVARALRRWVTEAGEELSDEFITVTEALVRSGRITPGDRAYLVETHLRTGEQPDEAAVRSGLLTEEEFATAAAAALGLPLIDLTPEEQYLASIDPLGRPVTVRRFVDPVQGGLARRLSEQEARAGAAIPVRRQGDRVVVAFAWPSGEHVAALSAALGEPVAPALARRSHLDTAIARHLGRPRLGDSLMEAGLVRSDQLEAAAQLGQRTGLRLGEALVSLGIISETQLAAHLAEQHDLPLFDLQADTIDPEAGRLVPKAFAGERQVLPISRSEDELVLAMADPTDRTVIHEVEQLTGLRVRPVLVTPSEFAAAFQELHREENIRHSASDLMTRTPEDSASRVVSDAQKSVLLGLLVFSALMLAWQPLPFLVALVGLTNFFYLVISFYKFYLIYNALGHSLEIGITAEEVGRLDEQDLPVYTILVPLYRETEVLPTLVAAMGRLDYPKAKLDVKLLLEEDDTETIRVARASRLPSHFQIVVVPHGRPKGKPKACNYGLLHARGTYTVIFDAEDVPDPDQLKKVVVAFRKAGPQLGCVQCKLNYYNQDQNLLTRWFTSEYSMWFDLFLPGLDATGAPIPLGGTSNHFPTIVLQELGAWDPYNVTEDADLGIRLFKRGYTTAVVDSTTYEEANSDVFNWIRQRSRWVKGYIQTWLVHMRNPVALYRAVGFKAFFSIQMTIGGTFFTFLVNPIFWALTVIWFMVHWDIIDELFPGPIFYIGSIMLFFGNFTFTYASMMGCLYRGYYSLIKYNMIIVLYWYLMSFAAWKGLLQLFRNPFYWEKTVHGLYRGPVVPGGGQGGGHGA